MTENMKKAWALASQNKELLGKFGDMSQEEIIALANEHGIALTKDDFAPTAHVEKQLLSDEELDNVSGGGECANDYEVDERCSYCGAHFTSNNAYEKHMTKVHNSYISAS